MLADALPDQPGPAELRHCSDDKLRCAKFEVSSSLDDIITLH